MAAFRLTTVNYHQMLQLQFHNVIIIFFPPGYFTIDDFCYRMPNNSTSNISVAFGGIEPPAPRAP